MKTPKQIFEDLVEKALTWGLLHTRNPKNNKPGALVEKLPKEDREILSQLTYEDVEKAAILRSEYWDTRVPDENAHLFKNFNKKNF